MGTPIPPNEPANDCLTCWGPGKPFADGATPKFLPLRFRFFEPGTDFDDDMDQILLTVHHLRQQLNPCRYMINDGIFTWEWFFEAPLTSIEIIHNIKLSRAFFSNLGPPCLEIYFNTLDQPFGNIAFGGFLEITWNWKDL